MPLFSLQKIAADQRLPRRHGLADANFRRAAQHGELFHHPCARGNERLLPHGRGGLGGLFHGDGQNAAALFHRGEHHPGKGEQRRAGGFPLFFAVEGEGGDARLLQHLAHAGGVPCGAPLYLDPQYGGAARPQRGGKQQRPDP